MPALKEIARKVAGEIRDAKTCAAILKAKLMLGL